MFWFVPQAILSLASNLIISFSLNMTTLVGVLLTDIARLMQRGARETRTVSLVDKGHWFLVLHDACAS